ncbi:ATP-dependent nuclease [Mucilaginibacter segetis]|uniref:AAA family ATPase n=1 Tax=Mucilaginibacter segetis TaxID=2793071 RepID=A0A934PTJ7_9SPHI|nr:AAA family ATPase [Mucilaginibacter segetis]MBK0379336.1 AAA family ATPase [Mucilaginibacter segetis]
MYISKLSIRNFRNFKNICLSFSKGVNTIIGENGSGKTNILQALRYLIDETMPRHIRFYESDFNRSIGDWRGHWIIIQLEFGDLDVSEEAQVLAMHKAGTMDELDSSKGSYSLILRPKDAKRRELYDYSQDTYKTQAGLKDILDYLTINDYELTFRGRGNGDFSDDDIYRDYVGDFENIVFPNPDEQENDVYGIRLYGVSLPNELSCTFIKALRDVEADLRSYKDNPLLNLLRGKEKTIDVAKKDDIIKKVDELNAEITELDEVKSVSQGISDSIRQAVGETYAPTIDIKSELPADMEKLLQSLKLWVGDPDEDGYQGKIWELSLGGANLIYLSLKLLEYEKVKSDNKIANFLLIEEPEAHIHTHIQKTLFQKLHSHNTQILITTHSTQISSVSRISTLNVLSRSKQQAVVFNPSNGLTPSQITGIERYLDAVRTNLLFAKGVLLVEGDAEQILIPALIKAVFGVTLDEIGLTLVNIGSTGFENIAILFHDDRVKKKCAILTDLDTSILPLPPQKDDESAEIKGCRNSQISGLTRKDKLDAFIDGNTWIEVFYAKYTFEVDFLQANNSYEIKLAIADEYKTKKTLDDIGSKLDDANVAVAGKEVLRLAQKFGKGWFAIMISENINHLTVLPDYIIKAIAFAFKDTSWQALIPMVSYRLKALAKSTFDGDKTDYKKILEEFSAIKEQDKALSYFVGQLPKDPISLLIKYMTHA